MKTENGMYAQTIQLNNMSVSGPDSERELLAAGPIAPVLIEGESRSSGHDLLLFSRCGVAERIAALVRLMPNPGKRALFRERAGRPAQTIGSC